MFNTLDVCASQARKQPIIPNAIVSNCISQVSGSGDELTSHLHQVVNVNREMGMFEDPRDADEVRPTCTYCDGHIIEQIFECSCGKLWMDMCTSIIIQDRNPTGEDIAGEEPASEEPASEDFAIEDSAGEDFAIDDAASEEVACEEPAIEDFGGEDVVSRDIAGESGTNEQSDVEELSDIVTSFKNVMEEVAMGEGLRIPELQTPSAEESDRGMGIFGRSECSEMTIALLSMTNRHDDGTDDGEDGVVTDIPLVTSGEGSVISPVNARIKSECTAAVPIKSGGSIIFTVRSESPADVSGVIATRSGAPKNVSRTDRFNIPDKVAAMPEDVTDESPEHMARETVQVFEPPGQLVREDLEMVAGSDEVPLSLLEAAINKTVSRTERFNSQSIVSSCDERPHDPGGTERLYYREDAEQPYDPGGTWFNLAALILMYLVVFVMGESEADRDLESHRSIQYVNGEG